VLVDLRKAGILEKMTDEIKENKGTGRYADTQIDRRTERQMGEQTDSWLGRLMDT